MARLPRLPRGVPLFEAGGQASIHMQKWWQQVVEALEGAQDGIADIEVNTPPSVLGSALSDGAGDNLTPPAHISEAVDPLIPPAHVPPCDDLLYPPRYGA